MRLFLHIIIPLAIIFLGFTAFSGLKELKKLTLFGKEVGPEKKGPGKARMPGMKRPMLRTKAWPLEKTDHMVQLQSQGEVRTHNATSLTAQISGRVTHISPQFEDGAFFRKDDILLELDTADYLTELASAKAQLARTEAAFAQEKARAKQALLNWKDAGFTEEPSDLVLRKPQLREAEAAVNSARSSLQRAERNLARTKVRAPYDGRVRKREIGLGQQIGGSTPLGTIFSIDFAEVRLPLTTRDLAYYTPPQKPGEQGKKDNITFTSILTAEEGEDSPTWHGTILRAEGELDENSRQLFVIARIDDPFALQSDSPPLYIGQPVRATIPAKTLKDVYVIPRQYLSGLNEILVIREGKLKRLDIFPLWSGAKYIVTRNGIQSGDQLATSRLPYAPEGAPVEIIPNADESEKDTAQPGDSRRVGRKKRARPKK